VVTFTTKVRGSHTNTSLYRASAPSPLRQGGVFGKCGGKYDPETDAEDRAAVSLMHEDLTFDLLTLTLTSSLPPHSNVRVILGPPIMKLQVGRRIM